MRQRAIARLYFLAVLVPISMARRARKSSPFGEKAHRAPSAWDR
ncbi:MAG: hypothetical protein QOE53_1259 [Pseudonocardiales bacterium]|jgi:hypothetical protein|nr:hypothetical protein [Pseudonocardiales bacterium]